MSTTASQSAERTSLAWRRTALTALATGAVAARSLGPVAGVLLVAVALTCWVLPGRRHPGGVAALVTGLQVVAGLLLLVLVLG